MPNPPVEGDSDQPNIAGVTGKNSDLLFGIGVFGTGKGGSRGIVGQSDAGTGVDGTSGTGFGVSGQSGNMGVNGKSTGAGGTGVQGWDSSGSGTGVHGVTTGVNGAGIMGENTITKAMGILGGLEKISNHPAGVYGESGDAGVYGHATGNGTGVFGHSAGTAGAAVVGDNTNTQALGILGGWDKISNHLVGAYGESSDAGVYGHAMGDAGTGVFGHSAGHWGRGVVGDNTNTNALGILAGRDKVSNHLAGVYGQSSDAGVYGHVIGDGGTGVFGNSTGPKGRGVAGYNSNSGVGVYGESTSGLAGQFIGLVEVQGDVQVTGDLVLINSPASGDVAEDFDLEDDPTHAEPGTVLVINSNGKLCASVDPYDTRVAGVVSGAGEFRPAVVLQRIKSAGRRSPIALIGKTFCKVDASFGSITGGDLLTTSATPGHAMKVSDRSRAVGTILGKALGTLESGRGLIPILVSLR